MMRTLRNVAPGNVLSADLINTLISEVRRLQTISVEPPLEMVEVGGVKIRLAENFAIIQDEIASNTDDYALNDNRYFLFDVTDDCDLTGLEGGKPGSLVFITNVGSGILTFRNQTGSADQNQFKLAGGTDLELSEDQTVMLWYDAVTGYWRIVGGVGSGSSSSDPILHDAHLEIEGCVVKLRKEFRATWGNYEVTDLVSICDCDCDTYTYWTDGTIGMGGDFVNIVATNFEFTMPGGSTGAALDCGGIPYINIFTGSFPATSPNAYRLLSGSGFSSVVRYDPETHNLYIELWNCDYPFGSCTSAYCSTEVTPTTWTESPFEATYVVTYIASTCCQGNDPAHPTLITVTGL